MNVQGYTRYRLRREPGITYGISFLYVRLNVHLPFSYPKRISSALREHLERAGGPPHSSQLGDHNFNVACETGLRYPTIPTLPRSRPCSTGDCEILLYVACIQRSCFATLTGHEILEHAVCSGANCCAVSFHRYYVLEEGKPGTLTQMILSTAFTEYQPFSFEPSIYAPGLSKRQNPFGHVALFTNWTRSQTHHCIFFLYRFCTFPYPI